MTWNTIGAFPKIMTHLFSKCC